MAPVLRRDAQISQGELFEHRDNSKSRCSFCVYSPAAAALILLFLPLPLPGSWHRPDSMTILKKEY